LILQRDDINAENSDAKAADDSNAEIPDAKAADDINAEIPAAIRKKLSPYQIEKLDKGILSLSYKHFSLDELKQLCDWLDKTPLIFNDIRLNSCNLGVKNTINIVRILSKKTHIKCLDLDENSLGSEGIIKLAKVLEGNDELEYVSLVGNGITDKGVAVISDLFYRNKNLKYIKFEKNKITNEGASIIYKLINENINITECSLDRNEIDDTTLNNIKKILQVRQPHTKKEVEALGKLIELTNIWLQHVYRCEIL